eukprot:c7331_g1_i1.p1 GENE.c7331_g1_i1~~c7331_g1_i1.p1  ORF type:complete len:413 (-),score=42.40 c7331_g1_i1:29-1225(-)
MAKLCTSDRDCDIRAWCAPNMNHTMKVCQCEIAFFLMKNSVDGSHCVSTTRSQLFSAAFLVLGVYAVSLFFWTLIHTLLGFRKGVVGRDVLSVALILITFSNMLNSVARLATGAFLMTAPDLAKSLLILFLGTDTLAIVCSNCAIASFALTVLIAMKRTIQVLKNLKKNSKSPLIMAGISVMGIASLVHLVLAWSVNLVSYGVLGGSSLILLTWLGLVSLVHKFRVEISRHTAPQGRVSVPALVVLSKTTHAALATMSSHVVITILFVTSLHSSTLSYSDWTPLFFLLAFTFYTGTLTVISRALVKMLQLRYQNALGDSEQDSSSALRSAQTKRHTFDMFVVRHDSAKDLFDEINRRMSTEIVPVVRIVTPETLQFQLQRTPCESPHTLQREKSVSNC